MKNMENFVEIVTEILFFQTNMNIPVFRADIMYYNQNMNSLKFSEKKFINRLKDAEHKIFCICVDVYKIYEGNDYEKIFEILSELKNKKLKKYILIEKYKDMLENHPDFEQNCW